MSKIKFIGESNENFIEGNIYQLIKLEKICRYEFTFSSNWLYEAYISNKNNTIVIIQYLGIETFNDNWEIVNE